MDMCTAKKEGNLITDVRIAGSILRADKWLLHSQDEWISPWSQPQNQMLNLQQEHLQMQQTSFPSGFGEHLQAPRPGLCLEYVSMWYGGTHMFNDISIQTKPFQRSSLLWPKVFLPVTFVLKSWSKSKFHFSFGQPVSPIGWSIKVPISQFFTSAGFTASRFLSSSKISVEI